MPKDTRALLHIAGEAGYDFSLLAGAIASNEQQLARVVAKVEAACGGSVDGDGGGSVGSDVQGEHG